MAIHATKLLHPSGFSRVNDRLDGSSIVALVVREKDAVATFIRANRVWRIITGAGDVAPVPAMWHRSEGGIQEH